MVVIQFLSGVVPLAAMPGFTPFLLQLLALRLSTCLDSGHSPSSNQSSLSPPPPPCLFQVFFGRPRFLLPLSLRSRATLKTLSSSLLSTCPYHLTPFTVANRSSFLQPQHVHLFFSRLSVNNFLTAHSSRHSSLRSP